MRPLALSLIVFATAASAAEPAWREHPEWKSDFAERRVAGTLLVRAGALPESAAK
ncbi:MAG TPA: hypothetical protein VF132_08760 [Rudaea sp.]